MYSNYYVDELSYVLQNVYPQRALLCV